MLSLVQDQEKPKPTPQERPTVVVPEKKESTTVPTLEQAQKDLQQTPGGVQVVDAEEYKRGRASTVSDVFSFSPGVIAQPRFGAEEARLSIRGSGIQRTFHGRGIRLLQDGAPLNLSDGGFDFQAVEALSARYVEVFRGANALRFGSSTLGGAVNFATPSGYDADPFQSRFEGGSFGYIRGQVSSGMEFKDFDYFASIAHFSQEGFRDHAEQSAQRFFSNAGWKLSRDVETRMYVTYVQTDSELPGSITKAQMKADPNQAASLNVTQDQKRDFPLVRVANKWVFGGTEQRLEATAFWSWKHLDHPIIDAVFAPIGVIDQESNDFGVELRYVNESPLWTRKNRLVLGLSPNAGITHDQRFRNVGGSRGAKSGNGYNTAVNVELYVEEQHYFDPQWAIVVGSQFTYATRDFDDRFLANGDTSEFDDYIGVSPKIGLRFDYAESCQAFVNVSRSFEPPSFGELQRVLGFTPGTIISVDLHAQTATTVEIGTRGKAGVMEWEATYFYAWIEDELLALNGPTGAPLGTVNADRTVHQGVELGFQLQFIRSIFTDSDRIVIQNVFTWSDFRFDGDDVYNNHTLAGIPAHWFRAEIRYEHPIGLYVGVNVEWVADKYPIDHDNSFFADPYELLGVRAGYRPSKGFSVFVEGRNLTDEIYAATTGVIADANGADSAQFFSGDGISVYGGLEYRR
jgi:iron complex outermembrane receptor protein